MSASIFPSAVCLVIMGSVSIVLLLVLSSMAIHCKTLTTDTVDENRAFDDFKLQFNKHYHSADDERRRKQVFVKNREFIARHNQRADSGLASYRLAVNKFADMTSEEVIGLKHQLSMGSKVKPKTKSHSSMGTILKSLPKSVDWRTKSIVSSIKDQDVCHAGYAFGSIAAIEGQFALKKSKLVQFSAQNLIDCSQEVGNCGCSSGTFDKSFDYTIKHGLDTSKFYPYTGVLQKCQFNASSVAVKLKSYNRIKTMNETDLEQAVANIGPVAVTIDASQDTFLYYKSGVYDEPGCSNVGTELNHVMAVVGYGEAKEKNGDVKQYWLVKNSWGINWGEDGYVRMARNMGNQCGIATDAGYPIVA